MPLEKLIKLGILIYIPEEFCPNCNQPMKHGFRINTYKCQNCGYIE